MIKKIVKVIAVILVIIIIIAATVLIYFSIREYRPKPVEELTVNGTAEKQLSLHDEFRIMTFNIGYGANSADADFFMDGGKMVEPDSKEIVERNLKGIMDVIREQNADVLFLQEADRNSKRSYHIDQVREITDQFQGNHSFAHNFLCDFVPYPVLTPIGKVDGGLVSLSKFQVERAQRYSLPTPFKWPVRTCQLKRALLVQRIPIEDSDKELVLVNLHLEAYDDGEGKKAQTELLAKILEEEYAKGNYCIAGGDFNQSFPLADNSKYPIIKKDYFVPASLDISVFSNHWQFAVDDSVPTSRLLNEPYDKNSPDTQYYVIDGFILSDNLTLEEVKTVDHDFAWSDHNPVVLKVSFK